jgi:hypothetical protein
MRAGISGQSTLKTTAKSAALGLVLALSALGAPPAFEGPHDAGLMAEPRQREASGLAPSRRTDGVFWTHNDSGNEPVAFAIDTDGRARGRVRLVGTKVEDWEDLASFELDGKPWLLVADCGDNFTNRPRGVLHVLAEPDPAALAGAADLAVAPAYSVHFIFEDGPRDCEAVAVDAADRAVWLLSKRDDPARLYRLPLAAAPAETPAVARFVGTVAGLANPTPSLRQRLMPSAFTMGRWPTALGFSPDRSCALVLTYAGVLVYAREPDETWADALARPPRRLAPHTLPQAEAACFSRDGRSLYVCSEQTRRWMRSDHE